MKEVVEEVEWNVRKMIRMKRNDEDEEQETQMGMEMSEECVCVKDVRWKRNKLIAIEFKS